MTTSPFKGAGRPDQYKSKEGARLPSVTTILGRFKDSGPLMHWAFSQGKAAERGEINRLYDKRDEAAEIGTLAHEMAEAHIHGIDPAKLLASYDNLGDEAMAQARQAFDMFARWCEIVNVQWLHTEVPLISERLGVGGTVDAVALVGGKLSIVDFKTSKGIYADYWVQCAAYADFWLEATGEQIEEVHILRFGKHKPEFEHQFRQGYANEKRAFDLMVDLYTTLKAIK